MVLMMRNMCRCTTLMPSLKSVVRVYPQLHLNNDRVNRAIHTCVPLKSQYLEKMLDHTPSWLTPYLKLARVDRPTGTWLLYIPCMWSIALASPPGELPNLQMLALFGLGAFLMRGAGCTINDLWDKNIDDRVERTKSRPLPSGQLDVKRATVFLGLQLSCALGVLLQLNWYSVCLGFMAMVPVVTYPLFKRFTYWPQFVLGLTFNWGALLGYSAIVGHIAPLISLPLYIAGINWTLVYDTIYAHQDIEDDLIVGVKSTAILFGKYTKPYLGVFQLGLLSGLVVTGINADAGWIYFAATGLMNAHLAWLIYKTNLSVPQSCLSAFKANRTTGLILFAGIVLDNMLTGV